MFLFLLLLFFFCCAEKWISRKFCCSWTFLWYFFLFWVFVGATKNCINLRHGAQQKNIITSTTITTAQKKCDCFVLPLLGASINVVYIKYAIGIKKSGWMGGWCEEFNAIFPEAQRNFFCCFVLLFEWWEVK